jgi:aspartyl-tRNA(Asn)/glutamyl-tRNA(Gln) amidotransferase subunit A
VADALHALTVIDAGRRLRSGALTAEALADACLARIDELNARHRAFITVTADEARRAARDADRELAAGRDRGPLHGIPVSLKDLIDQAGAPTTAGSHVRPAIPAAGDAVVTARLRAGGAVLVGKTNLHEFAFGTTSEDTAFGAVRHPLDPERSAGGSSGGSAVAVATGMSILSIGTDTGGSVRIPSAACGLVGLKGAYGEVPCDGVVPLSETLDHVGPLARTVADAAAAYYVLSRRTARPPRPVAAGSLRLGRLSGYFEEVLAPGVRQAYARALDALAHAGATIEPVTIPHAHEIPAIYLHLMAPEAAAYHARTLESCPERYTPAVRTRLEACRYMLAEDHVRARQGQRVLRAEVDAALASRDALVLPGLPIEAPPLGSDQLEIDGRRETVRSLTLRLTQPFNVSGHPAIVLPAGESDRLPVSLQLVGHHGATALLLDVAATAEHVLAGRGADTAR